jgi:DNA helicase-2/ATP-dependent DNA helicase PcrA
VVVDDWKTGAPPKDEAARASRELQLAVYRLAWSRWTGTPLDRVRAAFCYVGAGVTVYPERLLDEAEIAELLSTATRGPQAPGAVTPRANRRGARTNAAARRRPGWETSKPSPRPAAPTLFDSD